MAKYFAGNTLASFFRTAVTIQETTTASRFDSAFVPNSINNTASSSTDYMQTVDMGSVTGTTWTHFECYEGSISGDYDVCIWYNGLTPCYKMSRLNSASNYRMSYWNGSAWVQVGTTWTITVSTLSRYDVKIVNNTSFEVYLAGVLVASGTSGFTGGTTWTNIRFYFRNSNLIYYSQVLAADFDTRDSKYMISALNGNSATNVGGTGSYTTINETPLDETNGVSIATATNKQGQTHAAITVPSGYIVDAAVLNARGRASGTITDGKLGFRSGTTNYSSSGRGYNAGYEPRIYIVDNDPDTATRWTQSGYNAAEVYEEAV